MTSSTASDMEPPTADDVQRAAENIRDHVRRTPALRLERAGAVNVPVWIKLECLQITGSFKARNAFSLLLGADVPEAGVVAVSGGNFGFAVAHAARQLGYPITVFVPKATPVVKVDGMRHLGAQVELVAGPIMEIFGACDRRIAETGALLAHPFDQSDIIAGAGTCGLELDEQCPGLDTVLVAVGGGGLISGIAAWFGDRARVVAVETEGTPTLHRSLAAGTRIEVEPSGIALSALGAPVLGEIPWRVAQRWVDESILVTDDDTKTAQRQLWDVARVVAEPGGAVAFAALSAGVYKPARDERVGVVICGGNTHPGTVVDR